MGGLPIPETLPISDVRSVFAADGTLLTPGFDAKARSLVAELCWYARRMKSDGD
jgi:hypothetical protein